MLEPGHYIVRDLAYGRYIGRSTIEENTWDPKPIYSLDDLEVLCSGYPLWEVEKTRRRGFRLLTENGVSAVHDGNLVALLVEGPRIFGERWHIVPQPKYGQDIYTIEGKEGALQWAISKENTSAGYRVNVIPRQNGDEISPSKSSSIGLFKITKAMEVVLEEDV